MGIYWSLTFIGRLLSVYTQAKIILPDYVVTIPRLLEVHRCSDFVLCGHHQHGTQSHHQKADRIEGVCVECIDT